MFLYKIDHTALYSDGMAGPLRLSSYHKTFQQSLDLGKLPVCQPHVCLIHVVADMHNTVIPGYTLRFGNKTEPITL
jgi:hypothetical protein